jgi:glycosyltransferase involved in cell wall biosynthesis
VSVLHVTSTLDPAWGGPVTVLAQLSRSSLESGCETEVVTLDSPDSPWLAAFPARVHALGPSRGRFHFNRRLVPWLESNLSRYELALVHGLWQQQTLAVRAVAIRRGFPYAVCAHGGIAPWLNRRYPLKRLKKQVYWSLAEHKTFRDAACVVYACEEERLRGRSTFWPYRASEVVAPFGLAGPSGDASGQRELFLSAHPEARGKKVLLFLGRLHPVKGCDLLLDAFAAVRAQDPQLHLVMAGPDEIGWRRSLSDLASSRGVGGCVTWTGLLTEDGKWGALHAADAFVLPSHSESFGMAAVEAMSCGVPVLVTREVGVWREVAKDRAGLVGADTAAGVATMLRDWLQLDDVARSAMGARAVACFEEHFEVKKATEVLLRAALESATQPAEGRSPS